MPDNGINFGKTLLSPPVIIGGIALGAVILLMNAGNASANVSQGSPTADPAVLNANVAMNQTAATQQVQLAQIAAGAGANTLDYNLQSQGQILSFLTNMNNNSAQVNQTLITSNAGVTQSQIAASTSLGLDIQNNMNRLQLAQVQAAVSADQTQAQVNIATIQANAATKIARTNAISGIVTGVAKIASAPFTGGASLLAGGGGSSISNSPINTSTGSGFGTGLVASPTGTTVSSIFG